MKSIRQDLGDLLKASYLPEKDAQSLLEKKKYKIDPDLSSPETKVFVDEAHQPLILHPHANRLAAAMHQDDTDPDGIEKSDVLQEELNLFDGLHRTTAILDQEDPTPELLEVGKRLEERLRTLAGCNLGSHELLVVRERTP